MHEPTLNHYLILSAALFSIGTAGVFLRRSLIAILLSVEVMLNAVMEGHRAFQPVIDAIIAEQQPMRERAQRYLDDPTLVRNIVADGCEKARKMAQETLRDVREVMGLGYS